MIGALFILFFYIDWYMVYRKRNYNRGRRRFNRKPKTWGQTAWNVASKAYKTARFVKSLVNVEYKNFDRAIDDSVIGTAGTVYSMCNIPQGTTSITRIGDSAKIKSIYIRGQISGNPAATYDQWVRIGIVIDKLNALPGTTDPTITGANYGILTDVGSQGMMNLAHSDRYKVLLDQMIQLPILTAEANSQRIKIFKYFKKMHMETKFRSGTEESPTKNGLWLFVESNDNTNKCGMNLISRVRFLDN